MMQEISAEVLRWLPKLWRVGVEKGLETQLVRRSLVINQAADCGSRAEFSDIDFELTITDTTRNVVYKDGPYILQSIAWVWKELVVSSASKKEETKTILAEIEHLKLKEEVYGYLQREEEKERPDGYGYWDGHWTPGMRAAAIRLLDE